MEISLYLMVVINLLLRAIFNQMATIFNPNKILVNGLGPIITNNIGLEVMVAISLNSMVLEMEIHGNPGLVISIIGTNLYLNVKFVLERVTLLWLVCTGMKPIINQFKSVRFVEKKGYIAINCKHRGNYSYQGNQPSPSLSANYAY